MLPYPGTRSQLPADQLLIMKRTSGVLVHMHGALHTTSTAWSVRTTWGANLVGLSVGDDAVERAG